LPEYFGGDKSLKRVEKDGLICISRASASGKNDMASEIFGSDIHGMCLIANFAEDTFKSVDSKLSEMFRKLFYAKYEEKSKVFKAPSLPRAQSALHLFHRKVFKDLQQKDPNVKFIECRKNVEEMWNNLPEEEKAKYEAEHREREQKCPKVPKPALSLQSVLNKKYPDKATRPKMADVKPEEKKELEDFVAKDAQRYADEYAVFVAKCAECKLDPEDYGKKKSVSKGKRKKISKDKEEDAEDEEIERAPKKTAPKKSSKSKTKKSAEKKKKLKKGKDAESDEEDAVDGDETESESDDEVADEPDVPKKKRRN
jgi:hypothetical protein